MPSLAKTGWLLCFACAVAWADADEALFKQAVRDNQHGQYARARAAFSQLTARHPQSALFWFNLGSAAYNQGDARSALPAFQRAIALKSPLAPAAEIAVAKCLRKLGRPKEAISQLRAVSANSEMRALAANEISAIHDESMRHGFAAYEARDYRAALDSFDTATATPNDGDAALMKGLSLMRLGRADESRASFRQVLAQSRNREYRDDAHYFLEQSAQRGGEGPFWAYVDVGAGYDSNIYLDGVSGTPTAGPLVQTLAGIGVQATGAEPWLARLGYTLYWEEPPGNADGRFLSHSARGQLGYSDANWLVKLLPVAQYQFYGTSSLALRYGSGVQVQRSWDVLYLGAQGEYLSQAGQSTFTYLTGSLQSARLYLGGSGPRHDLSFGVLYSRDAIGDEPVTGGTVPLNNTSFGANVVWSWYPTPRWQLDASAQYLHRSYQLSRTDDQFAANARASYGWTPDLKIFVNGGVLGNASTMDSTAVVDKNYSQLIGLVGVSWEILD